MRFFVFLLSLFFASNVIALEGTGKRYEFADLTPLSQVVDNVERKLTSDLGAKDALGSLRVNRIYDSDWFSVSLSGNQYLVDKDARNWLQTDFSGLFRMDDGINPIVVSNDTRESLMDLLFFVNQNKKELPRYRAKQERLVVYAFIDMTCPHCRAFHLTEKPKFEKRGVSFVYIPFLRNVTDKKARSENLSAFCGSEEQVKEKIDEVFLKPVREIGRRLLDNNCSKYEDVFFDFMLGNGERYNLRGSPMFLTIDGQVFYGSKSLENYLKNILM